MAAMQSLMDSMSPQMRDELEGLMQSSIDPEFMNELGELAGMMYDMFPFDDMAREYPFMGDESMTLDQAMDLMGQLQVKNDEPVDHRGFRKGKRPGYSAAPVMPDDGERLVAWSNVVLLDDQRGYRGALAIGADITERAEAEQARDGALRMLSSSLREV